MPLRFYWKRVGVFITFFAVILNVIFFWTDFRWTIPVFAISSYFMEHKMFTSFPTNVTDEIIMLLYLIGLGFIVFSKEKLESGELTAFKQKLFIKASFINTIFLVFSVLFIYGGSYIGVLVINLISQFIIYLFLFYFVHRNRREKPLVIP
ncbi:MAG: hypothetical protein ACK5UE_11660 [Chitinophagales bacterium]|jgi:hypothetical protein|nr:hypothetical protein [Sphingobacteriales bacterium]